MRLRQAMKILCRQKNYFWRPRMLAYAYGLGKDPRLAKAIQRYRAYRKKKGGKK